jgi:hypothetical protein
MLCLATKQVFKTEIAPKWGRFFFDAKLGKYQKQKINISKKVLSS